MMCLTLKFFVVWQRIVKCQSGLDGNHVVLDVVEALLAVPDIDVNATGKEMFGGDTNRNDKDIDEKDKDGVEYTALMWASAKGHLEIVKALLDAGAEVNTSLEGRTALDWATLRGHDDVAQALRQGRGDEMRD